MISSKHDWFSALVWSFFLTLVLKVILTLVSVNLAIKFNKFPVVENQMDYSELIPRVKNPFNYLAQPFFRFDALWYEIVARTDYAGHPKATAFFPLFPWLAEGTAFYLRSSYFKTAYNLSGIFTFLTLYFLYLFRRLTVSHQTALKTILIFVFFPTAFFMLSSYAEPLLFTLFFGSLYMAGRRKYLLSSVLGMLSAMTKPYGWLVLIPIFGLLEKRDGWRSYLRHLIPFMLIPIGTLAVYAFQNYQLTGSVAGISPNPPTWRTLINPALHLYKGFLMLVRSPFDIPNLLNVVSAAAGIVLLFRSSERKNFSEWLFILLFLLITLSLEADFLPLISFARHFLLFYPFFGYLSESRHNSLFLPIYIGIACSLQIVLFVFFSFGFFVG